MSGIIPLGAEHAPEIDRLSRRFYPTSFELSAEDIASNLRSATREGGNFCFGIDRGGSLGGYWLAWIEGSRLEGSQERVVLVDDVVLLPEERHQVIRFIEHMLAAMAEAGWGGLPIEAVLRKSAEPTFTAHQALFRKMGYELGGRHEYRDEDLGESLVWIRYVAL